MAAWHGGGVEEGVRVGERVARLRKLRGLTQQRLAAGAHFSTSLVKQVEQGSTPPSAAFVANVAGVLGVTPAYLYGTEHPLVEEPDYGRLAELREAVDAWDDPRPEGAALTLGVIDRRLDAVSREVERSGARATAANYANAATELATLLHHLYPLAERLEPARAVLHDAYRLTATVAGKFRQADLAAVASERHIRLAPETGDPLRVAISAWHRSSIHLRVGNYAGGLRLLERELGHIDERSPVAAQLALRGAILAARSGDLGLADDFIEQARPNAASNSGYRGIDASPLNVAVHWCALPVEALDGAEGVRRGAQVKLADASRPERVGHHHVDQARAWFLHGNLERCLNELNAARRVAPFNTRHHPTVRETVIALATMDSRMTDSLAGFARWVGISLSG